MFLCLDLFQLKNQFFHIEGTGKSVGHRKEVVLFTAPLDLWNHYISSQNFNPNFIAWYKYS